MQKDMRVVLVQRGETRWERLSVFISRNDLELTDTGKQQMHDLGACLQNERFSAVYTSGMRRNTLSARLISPGVRIREMEGLAEMDYGEWEGLSPKQIMHTYPEAWALFDAGGPPPGGERYETFFRRVSAAVRSILLEQTESGTILIVLDPMSMRAALACLLELPFETMWRFGARTASVAVVDIGGGFSVLTRLS